MTVCWHCANDAHTRCKGGSWDDEMKPVPCSCWALRNHEAAVMTHRLRTYEEIQADRMSDQYEASLERGVSNV